MPAKSQPTSLLDELDQRQNDVLLQLDELNSQIENLLTEYLQSRQEELDGDKIDPARAA